MSDSNVAELAEAAQEGSRKMDPELRVMGQMLRLLDELPDEMAKARACAWLSTRFLALAPRLTEVVRGNATN